MKVKLLKFDSSEVKEIEIKSPLLEMQVDYAFLSEYLYKLKVRHHIPTNKTKVISEISGTTAKPYRQKGTGNARQGSLRSPQFRGGATIFGPVAQKRAVKIGKKETMLAKKMSLAAVFQSGNFNVIENCAVESHKTKDTAVKISKFNAKRVLVIHNGEAARENLLACRNLQNVKYLDCKDLTVFDLLHFDRILFTQKSLDLVLI